MPLPNCPPCSHTPPFQRAPQQHSTSWGTIVAARVRQARHVAAAISDRQTPRTQRDEPGRRRREEDASHLPLRQHRSKHWDTPRGMAVQRLIRIEDEGAFISLIGKRAAVNPSERAANIAEHRESRDQRKQRTVTELVAGVTRWRRHLDYLIEQLTGRQVAGLDPPVRQVLRLGLYELLELQMADHAVNEYVDVAKAMAGPSTGGFVNGVLRTAVRKREADELPGPPVPPPGASPHQVADAMAVAGSHPTWMVERWLEQFGKPATAALMRWNNARPSFGVRINRSSVQASAEQLVAELGQLGVRAEASRYLPDDFLRVTAGMQQLIAGGLLADGQCQVQDEAAGLVVAFLDPQPGEYILDACAAPGGKTLFMASRMAGQLAQGLIMAMDVNAARLRPLNEAAKQQGLAHVIQTKAADLRDYVAAVDPFAQRAEAAHGSGPRASPHLYDRVLLDAPCSGTGVLAKRADLRWRRQLADLLQLSSLQDELLDAASEVVKPGGLLVYSTCSIEPDENEQRVAAFLTRHGEFSLERPPQGLIPSQLLSEEGFLRTLPQQHGVDGAFAARLRRAPDF